MSDLNLAETKVTGLFGYPVEHSLSPAMHNDAFSELGLNHVYLPFSVEPNNLEQAVAGLRGLNITGVNVTIPHKQNVIPHLDKLSEEAELIGAVNTIFNDNGSLIGHNTDGRGFIRSLKEETDFKADGQKVLLVGAGGAARAIAFQLALEGISELLISDLDTAKAQSLSSEVEENVDIEVNTVKEEKVETIMDDVDLLVDATPVGMDPHVDVAPVVSAEVMHSDLIVYDVVYNPQETVLLEAAQQAGAEAVSGLGMLLYQGVIAFEIWTGEEAPVEVMRTALEEGIYED
ncbi:shikimate dehydrogenase [Halanaerobacter jeridensis]|uniref:shikimate dehydrogenase n=1 Tax=Halanaerobacter jeridensis TaxID=706427 RepID=UPI00195B17B6|nr:shikimate dehydrogenase [Halanaerobacter jeridensis]